ncbi:MAG TPA: hypothetical protein VL523_00640 [Terriglobia bacterium]|nr:hypothetical protein [Terriglobia bacterium]
MVCGGNPSRKGRAAGHASRLALELHRALAKVAVHQQKIARQNLAVEQFQGQKVLDEPPDVLTASCLPVDGIQVQAGLLE